MNSNEIKQIYLRPAFLACIIVLALSTAGKSVLVSGLGGYLKKEPLPLKKSLDLLDEQTLGPYKVTAKTKQENDDIIESLGTKDYIQWYLEDENEPLNSPVRKCVLFVTYYDLPDMVPHVPEICYVGGGNELVGSETVNIEAENKDFSRKIPLKYLVFSGSEGGFLSSNAKFPVLYCFYVNGAYGSSRADTRYHLNKYFFKKHSFFSKVELKFYNSAPSGMLVFPDKEQAIDASKKFLSILLPVLESDYWPDWNKQ